MSVRTQSGFVPSLVHFLLAILVALLAIGGAIVTAILLAAGVLVAWVARALGFGGRLRGVQIHRSARTTADRTTDTTADARVIEGEFRIVDPNADRQSPL